MLKHRSCVLSVVFADAPPFRIFAVGRVYIFCLVVWGLLAVGVAAKCVAVARDSHYRIPVIVKKQCVWTHQLLNFTHLLG